MKTSYLKLIDDTLAYIQALLPPTETKPLPPAPKLKPKPQVAPPPTPQKKPEPKKESRKELELHPPTRPTQESLSPIRGLLKTLAPDLYLHDTPPSDEKAKRIKFAWKEKAETPEIPIFFQGNAYRPFLENLAKAISLTFAPCRLIELQAKKWDLFLESPQLKLILCPDHLLFSSKDLLPFYRENPGQKTRFLGNIPLLLLPDLSLYFKDPYLKRSLWNVICQTLKGL